MVVAELIAELQKYPQDLEVLTWDEYDYVAINEVKRIPECEREEWIWDKTHPKKGYYRKFIQDVVILNDY